MWFAESRNTYAFEASGRKLSKWYSYWSRIYCYNFGVGKDVIFHYQSWFRLKCSSRSYTELFVFQRLLKSSDLPITAGSRSMKAARGTYWPDSHSSKIVWKLSSLLDEHFCLASTKFPSGNIPCSKQYNSQIELPICAPAWPMWIAIVSLYQKQNSTIVSHLSFIRIFSPLYDKRLSFRLSYLFPVREMDTWK